MAQFKLKTELARYLRDCPEEGHEQPSQASSSSAYHGPSWRVSDRLSEQDIAHLNAAFKAGTPKRVLAERYGIGLGSAKKLLRVRGVKQRSRYDLQK